MTRLTPEHAYLSHRAAQSIRYVRDDGLFPCA